MKFSLLEQKIAAQCNVLIKFILYFLGANLLLDFIFPGCEIMRVQNGALVYNLNFEVFLII